MPPELSNYLLTTVIGNLLLATIGAFIAWGLGQIAKALGRRLLLWALSGMLSGTKAYFLASAKDKILALSFRDSGDIHKFHIHIASVFFFALAELMFACLSTVLLFNYFLVKGFVLGRWSIVLTTFFLLFWGSTLRAALSIGALRLEFLKRDETLTVEALKDAPLNVISEYVSSTSDQLREKIKKQKSTGEPRKD